MNSRADIGSEFRSRPLLCRSGEELSEQRVCLQRLLGFHIAQTSVMQGAGSAQAYLVISFYCSSTLVSVQGGFARDPFWYVASRYLPLSRSATKQKVMATLHLVRGLSILVIPDNVAHS
jgi:hypothetical protein